MSLIPDDLVYSKNHLWLRKLDEFTGLCGITDHAQEMLKDIVFVEFTEEGVDVDEGEQIMYVESVIELFDIFSPVSGRITRVHKSLNETPENINSDPYVEGWLFEIEIRSEIELDDLMDAESYEEFIEFGE